MRLQGLHHITMITADAGKNVDFYADVLGLRLVKKTVNFDAPDSYHLYFGDERGSPGSLLTWFEFVDAARGSAGAGMIHTLQLGVAGEDALEFWEARLSSREHPGERERSSLRFTDYEGLALELIACEGGGGPPLRALHPEIPPEHAIIGLEGARAYAAGEPDADSQLLTETLGFCSIAAGEYVLDGEQRCFRWAYDQAPGVGVQGAGTVHHIAWHSLDEDHVGWQQRVQAAGMHVTPVIDREYFESIYFRQPQGVLFEIATTSPGFALDEDPAHLGEQLKLPPQHEHLRPELERVLRPLINPRTRQRERAAGA
jgi:glyoxalase family protein